MTQLPVLPLSRRDFLVGSALLTAGLSIPGSSRSAERLLLSVAEPAGFRWHDADTIKRRFEVYHEAGVKLLRTGLSFRQEQKDGAWSPGGEDWFKLAVDSGFRFRLEFEVLSGPPAWFLEDHPEARIIDRKGEFSTNDISPFWPGLEELLRTRTDRMMDWWKKAGYFDATKYVITDLGPAVEPLYPATWTLGPGHSDTPGNFWFYGPGAVDRFREAVHSKYGTVSAANAAWGTSFANWGDITIPEPGRDPGPLWHDVLIWYRIAKRDLIGTQLKTIRAGLSEVGSDARVVLLLPGTHLAPAELDDAVKSGSGDYPVTLMVDTEFIIDLAASERCTLQYTALPNPSEIAYVNGLREKKDHIPPLWAENIGVPAVSQMVQELVKEAVAEGLAGYEYVGVESLFGPDGKSPTPLVEKFIGALKAVR